ncbi:MAG: iron transporter [Magnetospirillum sp.]|nr:iron transporter [Magnetospirillum sp.]
MGIIAGLTRVSSRRAGRHALVVLSLLIPALVGGRSAAARDFAVYPVGAPQVAQGLNVAVEYFQPIELDGALMHPAAGADIHLEADISAAEDDPDGYAKGDWRPYLTVTYRLTRNDTGQALAGTLMPLVSYGGSGGGGKPHYGDNLKLMGPGRYRLLLSVAPPAGGVGGGFAPFTLAYDFVYAGVGKKGAY